MSNFADRIAALSPKQRELFELRIKKQSIDVSKIQITPYRRDCDSLPLSFAQQRLWFLGQLEQGKSIHNIPRAFRLKGLLNLAALKQSLNEIVSRHEALRTNFRTAVDGQPVQVIVPTLKVSLPVVNLQQFSAVRQETEVQQLATDEAKRPFNLEQAPLFRVTLLWLSEEEYVLLLTMHHIIADAWSITVFMQELSLLYEAFSQGKPSPLAELPIQYGDFALWQRQLLQGGCLDVELAYWKQQLDNSPTLQLPTDRLRFSLQTYQGTSQFLVLSKNLTELLKTFSRRERVTPFMTLLAAFKTLLYRYTEQEDIIVGSPFAGRKRAETEKLIGCFLNILVLRTDLSGQPSFRTLLERVRSVTLDAHNHQDLPFEKLVEELQPERDLSRNPLFQIMFVYNNDSSSMVVPELAGLSISPVGIDSGMAPFDLTLFVTNTGQKLNVALEYNIDLFDSFTISQMLRHFQTLLEAIVADPDQPISDLPLLTAAERHQLLVEWNSTQADYPKEACIHQLFETQVERTPDAVAIVFENQQLTYRELNRRSNQLAHHLQNLGVKPEVLVGICLERSPEMIVGLLGILKAGGAYVPLDPAYPRERLEFMLEDAQISVLLTQQPLVNSRFPKYGEYGGRVVLLDTNWVTVNQDNEKISSSGVTDENLAYAIYTSGSTGQPKGVQVSHKAMVNFINAMGEKLELTNQDILLSVTTLCFDIAALEIFLPICIGARLELVSPEVASDGLQLSERLCRSNSTVMQATPATWSLILEAGWPGNNKLKALCGGEILLRDLANQLRERVASLWNLYGPTETTIWSATYKVAFGESSISIGNPIANTQIYILDSHLQPVPIGVKGELYIGGSGLARGYLNRPDLTCEKFIPDPLSKDPGSRLYKTGDLARYLPNGNIEFLGRLDQQVKIRGFRIELGEIEAVLAQHPALRETVIIANEDVSGGKRLVAYIVLKEEQASTMDELRQFLKGKLPNYMVPSAFVFLDSLPLTSNGKVDRRALPAPEQSRPDSRTTFVTPRTPVEHQIADIWTQVLKLDRVGIHDNFFELGGHSLLATQVMSRLRQTFCVELPLRYLFEKPTVADLAKRVETLRLVTLGLENRADEITDKYEEGEL
jgi:amino acid adenylation domain-containing protein